MRITATAAVALVLASSISLASAQEPLNVEVGFSKLFAIPGGVENVVVGSTTIADVLPLAQNSYLLNAVGVGTTNVQAFDDQGAQIYYARVIVRPVDSWPSFPVRVTRGISQAARYMCDPGLGCRLALEGTPGPCTHPDGIAADGSRCGDRAASVRPGGLDGSGQPAAAQPPAQAVE